MAESKPEPGTATTDAKSPDIIERTKEEMEVIMHTPSHHKETHGKSDDIGEDTPPEEVKGPGVYQRVKEEIEAIVQAVHPKKEKTDNSSSQ